MKGCQISNPNVSQHHSIVGGQPQFSTQHGTHIPQNGHHGVELNRMPSLRETPLYLALAPVSTTLISGHDSQILQCGQSQPRAVVQSQQALLINTFQVPVNLSTLVNGRLHIGQQPQGSLAKVNSENSSSSHSSPVSQSHHLSGSRPTPDQISGSISVNSSLQGSKSTCPGVVTLLIKQSDLNTALQPGHVANGQRTVVTCGGNRSLQFAQETAVNRGGIVQSSSSLCTEQSASSILFLNGNGSQTLRGNSLTIVNSSNVATSHPNETKPTCNLTKPTCISAINSVHPLPTTIAQSPKAVSFQCLTTSCSGNSVAFNPHGSPTHNISSKSFQTHADVIHMQVPTFQGQSKMPIQRAVAVVPPISQQCIDDDKDDGREKQNGDEQPIKMLDIWSESMEKTKEKISESSCNPSVTGVDRSSTKSSSDQNRVEHESSHQTVPVTEYVPNLSQSTEQKPMVTKHPEVHGSDADSLKSKIEGTIAEPNQSRLTSSPSDKNCGPIDCDAHVSSRTRIVKYSLGMLKELVADLEAEHLKQNSKSDDGPDLVHTLLDLYWGGSSYNYMTAKCAIQNALHKATEFEVADESMVFDGIHVEDLYQLKDRFHILHEDCDVSSVLKCPPSTYNINEKVWKPDKEPSENSLISETCGALSPEQEKKVKGDDLCSDIKTMVPLLKGVHLEVPDCSSSAKTLNNTDVESAIRNHADNDQKPITDLSNLCVNATDAITSDYHSSEQNIPMSEKQDDCNIQKPENSYLRGPSPKPDGFFPVEMTILSSGDTVKVFNGEKNDKILRNEPPSPSPNTGEESIEDFSKIKIQVLSLDEAKALSQLVHDKKDGMCISSQDSPRRDAEDEKELEIVSVQKFNVNQEQSQVITVDDDDETLDLSGGGGDQSISTLNKSYKSDHNCPIANNKKEINKKKMQHGFREKSLTRKDTMDPRHVPYKTRNAQTLNGQMSFSKQRHGQTSFPKAKRCSLSPATHVHGDHHTKSIGTSSGKDLAKSYKRKYVVHHGEDHVVNKLKKSHGLEGQSPLLHSQAKDRLALAATPGGLEKEQEEKQSDCPPKISFPKLSIESSPLEGSAKEKVLRNWVSTYVPTDVRSRRPSDPIEKCKSLNLVDKRRLQKVKNDARYFTINRKTEKVGKAKLN